MSTAAGADALFERLRRLRRDPAPAVEAVPARAALPEWMRARLGRAPEPVPGVGEPLPALATAASPHGSFAVHARVYPGAFEHGAWRLEEIEAASIADIARLCGDDALAGLELSSAVYLDVETTGLSGGAGTVPFLVALGSFRPAGYELWQGFLRGPEEERALLHEVAERVRASSGVVSFFGKSFDRHRLEDKMRCHGIAPPFDDRPHLDLYHPLARLYRSAFADGRLATAERGLCGVARVDDLPGSFAPAAWFDYLAGRPHRLGSVFRHNADDVLSLVVLAAHLGRVLVERRADGRALDGPAPARADALARLFAERREREDALLWVERALARHDAATRRLRVLRADLWRLEGRREEALREYEALASGEPDELGAHCWAQVAKLCEHGLRDLERAQAAIEAGRRQVARLRTRVPAERLAKLDADLATRAERLARKRARGRPAARAPRSPAR